MSTLLARLDALARTRVGWAVLSLLVLVPQAWFVLRLSYPGRANVDVAYQARQALGEIPYTDWHPPVMSALWELLIETTGDVGSLFVLQTGVLFGAVWLLSLVVHRRTGRRRWTWWALLLPMTPWVLGQSAVLFKDTQMAVALLAGVALVLLVDHRRPVSLLLLVPALVLLVYATDVRKNAVLALVPLAGLIGWTVLRTLRPRRRPRWSGVAAAGLAALLVLGVASVALDRAVGSAKQVQSTGSVTQIMLDDVMFSVPDAELQASDAPAALKQRIAESRARCYEMGEIWDSYFNCYGRGVGGEIFSPLEHQEEIRRLWSDHVVTHPLRYLGYRAAVFSYYFFSSELEWWAYDWRGDAEDVGLGPQSRIADVTARYYVQDFAAESLPWLFKPWFWSVLGVVCVVLSRRAGPFRPAVLALALSALCYVAGYLPTVPANHFRYTFWPAVAVTVALGLLLAGRRTAAGEDPRS
ncbi:hypothetical protein GC722_16535 [Auraticoccus sp. F435]|uniref:Glycosyltransferase RgtA/B/C/D-like domain-containing protein n=1 Tax=Auraticoccus cholistanensis TaxID=2656650 RepID=A0A6A9V285_9ACTN|nr:hypothetical protein [Auraticoccus cholistanensis]MVA77611.1 hypothetical protein [Auraticoccus cholistanensis]